MARFFLQRTHSDSRRHPLSKFTFCAFIALLYLFGTPLLATAATTEQIYARHRDTVLQVRIVDRASGSKASIGSGFLVSNDGLVITNYHVIAELIHQPDRYRAEFLRGDGGISGTLQLVDIDIVHDLALLRGKKLNGSFLSPARKAPAKGERLFAFGNPHDLGLTIVEGTYNGLLENSLYDKIHFTGSINPGMSGGPVIDSDGAVIGVNVATAGNQIGFLVPARYVAELLKGQADEGVPLIDRVRDQLLANQERYLAPLLSTPFSQEEMQGHLLPAKLAPFIKCWGDSRHETDDLYEQVILSCSSNDDIFLAREQSTGAIRLRHDLFSSRELGAVRFYGLLEQQFNQPRLDPGGEEKSVDNFICTSDLINSEGLEAKAVYCLRPYKKLAGLYDAYFTLITLEENHQALQTSLLLNGVSAANAQMFVRRYLEAIRWNP